MKNTLLLFFLFCCSAAFAQQIDSCHAYSKSDILKAYNREVYPGDPQPDTFYLVHYFPVETEQAMLEYAKWAKQNGYQTLQDKTEYVVDTDLKTYGYILRMDRRFDFSTLEELEKEVNKLVAKRKELKLELCNGSALYSYESIIQRHKFPAPSPLGIDSCESYTKENIEKFYNNQILKMKVVADTLYFHHSFNVANENSLLEFDKWAKANGYRTIQRKVQHTIGDSEISYSYDLTLERLLAIENIADLENEINRVAAKRKELKDEKCYGTSLGIGANTIDRHKKYFKQ
ncbi:MAG: hypothetical protein AB7G44_15880 [Bacteroidia bacterium]